MKVKKVLISIICCMMILGSVLTVSAAVSHEHTYGGNYSYEEVYMKTYVCPSHEACELRVHYMNVFDSCTSCGFRTYVKTEQRVEHYIPLIDIYF